MDKTLLKGLGVLETLAASPKPKGVTALSRELDLTKSNTHRTLRTLVSAGYVRANAGTEGYECTPKLFEIANLIMERLDIRQVSGPYQQKLAEATQETIHLSVLDSLQVIYIDKVESSHPLRAYSAIGGRAPAHCVATGKALLAWQPEQQLSAIPDQLPRWTSKTLTSRQVLLDELAHIRSRGFSINKGEWCDTIGGAAAAVFDGTGQPVAAIGITGPLERLPLPTLRSYGSLIIETAWELSRDLGYHSGLHSKNRVV